VAVQDTRVSQCISTLLMRAPALMSPTTWQRA
jgi:hypothetical protein